MIKKILIILTITILLVSSTAPAFAQKPSESNGNGNSANANHGNSNHDNQGNGNTTNNGHGNPNAPDHNLGQGNVNGKNNENGFDEWGYNRTARIFNGTGWSWCMEKVGDETWCEKYLGAYANDKLVMKWNAEWDRGNAEGWTDTRYDAWLNNQWNGNVPGGSGEIWHYKYVWYGSCGADYTDLPNGGYCIWGQFEVILSHGVVNGEHVWDAHAGPAGYGYYP